MSTSGDVRFGNGRFDYICGGHIDGEYRRIGIYIIYIYYSERERERLV